jgi:hypothetical protein
MSLPELGLVAPLHDQGAARRTVPLLFELIVTTLPHARSIMMTAPAFERLPSGSMELTPIVRKKCAPAICMEICGKFLLGSFECRRQHGKPVGRPHLKHHPGSVSCLQCSGCLFNRPPSRTPAKGNAYVACAGRRVWVLAAYLSFRLHPLMRILGSAMP